MKLEKLSIFIQSAWVLFYILITSSIIEAIEKSGNISKVFKKVEEQQLFVSSLGIEDYENHEFPSDISDDYVLTDVLSNIHFYLYTKNNPTNPDKLFIDDLKALKSSNFIPNAPLKILTHGFNGNLATALFPADLNASYLHPATRDLNIILVDWSKLSEAPDYKFAVWNVPVVAEQEAKLIQFLVNQNLTSLDKVHLIGHSLGAHVSGDAGWYIQEMMKGQKVSRATGLDPAKPLFEFANDRSRIDPSDAEFVDVIHTTGLTVGLLRTLGHVDFYPNGGITQPGCYINLVCDHIRAYQYFAESVVNPRGFKACNCQTRNISRTNCNCESSDSIAYMGEYVSPSTRGIYYLETNSEPPYGMT